MDLKTAIDINAVIQAVREHKDLLTTVDAEDVREILQHFTPLPGVTDSITLGITTLSKVSHKYTGEFIGQLTSGAVQPRTLVVRPCVMEMSDEPEAYRRAYITEVKGGLDPSYHPFEVWLNNYGVKCASKELHDVVLIAKYDASTSKTDLKDSFDGPLTIIDEDRDLTADTKPISEAKGNLYKETDSYTAANIGFKLLKWFRSLPSTLRSRGVKLFMSDDMADLYDDWLDAQGTLVTGSGAETAGQKYLRNTNKKCEIVRMPGMPSNSEFMWITVKENQFYGYDKDSDMSTITPFVGGKGTPYRYNAAGKYVLGFQFATFDKSLFSCNNKPIDPAA